MVLGPVSRYVLTRGAMTARCLRRLAQLADGFIVIIFSSFCRDPLGCFNRVGRWGRCFAAIATVFAANHAHAAKPTDPPVEEYVVFVGVGGIEYGSALEVFQVGFNAHYANVCGAWMGNVLYCVVHTPPYCVATSFLYQYWCGSSIVRYWASTGNVESDVSYRDSEVRGTPRRRCITGAALLTDPLRCRCMNGTAFVPYPHVSEAKGRCVPYVTSNGAFASPNACSDPGRGNPIHPVRGGKREELELSIRVSKLPLKLSYDSSLQAPIPLETDGGRQPLEVNLRTIGFPWVGSMFKRVMAQGYGSDGYSGLGASVARGDGRTVTFVKSAQGQYVASVGVKDRLFVASPGFLYLDAEANAVEIYDRSGRLQSIHWAQGGSGSTTISDSSTPSSQAPAPGYLIAMTDDFGRAVQFRYTIYSNDPNYWKLGEIEDGAGHKTKLEYESERLKVVTWPDSNKKTFFYDYPNLSWLLTRIQDESNRFFATFDYDAKGLAYRTRRGAGNAGRYELTYGSGPMLVTDDTFDLPGQDPGLIVYRSQSWVPPTGVSVVSPLGYASIWQVGSVQGRNVVTSQSQPAGSGCAASISAQSYDANGNIASTDDFNGHRICYSHDLTRNLELVRVEGLVGGTACTSTASGSALPTGARKVSTQWHPQWRLQTRVAEPGRITTSVYNGQPDPFNGNTVASCAPASAKLPDNTPIAVLCRQVEQATTDADGSLGFAAPLQTGVAPREQRWTYNEFGQMLTHDGPRTDVADTTVYEYHSATAFTGVDPNAVGVTRGDLKKVTPPTGGFTLYKLYNKLGQVLQTEDANGVTTSYTYDPRQRLTSTTVAGQTTLYDYWPTGLIKKITQPDASWVLYEHDDAHRLVKVSDNLANSISYTLDNLGNRVDEQVKDPGGALRRNLGRGIDALGRVQQITGRESAP
jgi:YD repeat-containing protein